MTQPIHRLKGRMIRRHTDAWRRVYCEGWSDCSAADKVHRDRVLFENKILSEALVSVNNTIATATITLLKSSQKGTDNG